MGKRGISLIIIVLGLIFILPFTSSFNFQSDNSFLLGDLEDVVINSPINNQTIIYNSSSGLWYNDLISSGGSGNISGSGTTNFIPKWTSSTVLENSVLSFLGSTLSYNAPVGTDNSVLVKDSLNGIRTDEIDSKVWGTSLMDGSGSANYIPYWSDSDSLTYDEEGLYWNDVKNYLGVGISDPIYPLHVNGNAHLGNIVYVSGASPRFFLEDTSLGDVNWQVMVNLDDLSFWGNNANTKYVTYKNGGNVGFGTDTPVNKLDIEGAMVIGATYSGTNTAPTNGLLIEGNLGIGTTAPESSLHISNNIPAIILYDINGNQTWKIKTNNVFKIQDITSGFDPFVIDQNALDDLMYLDSTGVGILTTTPQNTLNVIGDGNFTGELIWDRAYSQTAYHNETTPLTITLTTEDLYYNITGLHLDYNNSIHMDGQAVIERTSMYQLSGSLSFSGGNSGLYRYNLFVNNVEEHACGSMRTTSTSQLGSLSINCLVYLEEDDIVNMRVKDTTSPVQDVNIYTLTFNMVEL